MVLWCDGGVLGMVLAFVGAVENGESIQKKTRSGWSASRCVA